jgi:hypothetical protein
MNGKSDALTCCRFCRVEAQIVLWLLKFGLSRESNGSKLSNEQTANVGNVSTSQF